MAPADAFSRTEISGRADNLAIGQGGRNMVVIDREKCIGCGLCAADCPAEKLTVTDGKAVYTPGCIQCGHCVAVCPRAAVSIPEYDMADVEEYDR